ncbi:hypothetical protein L9F63_019329, partial [Diploptera punctata]
RAEGQGRLRSPMKHVSHKNVNLKTYEGPKERNNKTVSDITIQRLFDDDENPNCQQVRRKKRKPTPNHAGQHQKFSLAIPNTNLKLCVISLAKKSALREKKRVSKANLVVNDSRTW